MTTDNPERREETSMKVYGIQSDGDYRIVEAESYGKAVAIWLAYMEQEFDYDGSEEPESVTMISDTPVVRDRECCA